MGWPDFYCMPCQNVEGKRAHCVMVNLVSFNRSSKLSSESTAQGTNSVAEVMIPRDLQTNTLVNQMTQPEFKPTTSYTQTKG